MSEKRKDIDRTFMQAIYLHPQYGNEARNEMAEMKDVISTGNKHIDAIIRRNDPFEAQKAGRAAEEAHAETFNLDAISKGDKSRAYTDKSDGWHDLELNGQKLHTDDVPDIVVAKEGKISTTVQSKYCKSAKDTADAMSSPKYKNMDQLLGPRDQINPEYKNVPGEVEPVATTTIVDHANAMADALEAKGEKGKVDAYRNTAKKATDRVSNGKSESTPFTNQEMKDLAVGDKTTLEKVESEYQTQSTLKHMKQTGLEAGAMSALAGGVSSALRSIIRVKDGEITVEEAAIEIVKETAFAAADSAVKASANVGLQSLAVRYGTEEAAVEILARQGMRSLLKANAITIGATCAIEGIKDLVRLGCGQISKEEFMDRQGKGAFMTASGTFGGTLGVELGTAVGMALGASDCWLTVTSAAGGLAGGLVAGLAMTLAIEHGVERPFREMVKNSEIMRENLKAATVSAKTMVNGVKLAEEFVKTNEQMERIFQEQIGDLRRKLGSVNEHAIEFEIIENEIRKTRSSFVEVQAQLNIGESKFLETYKHVREDGIRFSMAVEDAMRAIKKLGIE